MPTWRELERSCRRNGWRELPGKRDHIYFEKQLPDGTVLRTKVSRGSGEIPKRLWQQILKKQLKITMEEFNRGK